MPRRDMSGILSGPGSQGGWKRAEGWALFAALACALLVLLNLVSGWRTWPGLFPRSTYLVTDLLLVLLAACLVFLGFRSFRRGALLWPRCLLLLSACLATWAGLEVYITFVRCETSAAGFAMCQTHLNWLDRVPAFNQMGYWEDDLGPYLAGGPRDEVVMAVIGDSWTLGQGLPSRRLRFTDRLQQGLPGVRVLNFGKIAASTRSEAEAILPQALAVHPDVVLVAYWGNDIESSGIPRPPPRQRKGHGRRHRPAPPGEVSPDRWYYPLVVGLPLVNYAYWKLHTTGETLNWGEPYEDPAIFADHSGRLRVLLGAIQRSGARSVVAILPCPFLWPGADRTRRDRVYAALTEVIESTGTPVIPLQGLEDRFPFGRFEVSSMDPHPNAALHEAIAQGLQAWFRSHPDFMVRSSRPSGASSGGQGDRV